MRSAQIAAALGALALAGCATTSVEPAPLPCDTAAGAPVEAEPIAPTLTPKQRLAVDVAVATVLGPDLGAALIRFTDVEHPAWGRRQAARVAATVAECAGR